MTMEITVQTSQSVPGQQSLQKQGSLVDAPAIVVSDAKKITMNNDARPTEEPLKDRLSEIEYKVSQLSEIEYKVSQLNDHMQTIKRNLEFTVDDRSGASVITISDTETGEVIRQFPSEEVLNARNAVEKMKGLLIETKA